MRHSVALQDGVNLGLGKIGKNRLACGGAVRVETSPDGGPSGDDGVQAIDAIEADDAGFSRHGDAHTFIRAPGHLHEKFVGFAAKGPGFQGATSQFVQLQTQPVSLVR